VRRHAREPFAHERGVDELAGFQHHVRAMHRRAAATSIVVLEADPTLNDQRFQPLASTGAGLRLDAEKTHAANGGDGHGVARGDARDQDRITAKNCSGRHDRRDQFLHAHLQLAGTF
jgi:hypothetical protein